VIHIEIHTLIRLIILLSAAKNKPTRFCHSKWKNRHRIDLFFIKRRYRFLTKRRRQRRRMTKERRPSWTRHQITRTDTSAAWRCNTNHVGSP